MNKNIAVALLDVLPDGQNGGSMPFVIELLKGLAGCPGVSLLLLAAAHNVEFLQQCFLSTPAQIISMQSVGQTKSVTWQAKLSKRVQMLHRVKLTLNQPIDLLFCPMGAVRFDVPGRPCIERRIEKMRCSSSGW